MPTAELQRRLAHCTEAQRDVARKIRRRARNKLAARQSRQRRSGVLQRLDVEVQLLEDELRSLVTRRKELDVRRTRLIFEIQEMTSHS